MSRADSENPAMVVSQVPGHVVGIAQQRVERVPGHVHERLPRHLLQQRLAVAQRLRQVPPWSPAPRTLVGSSTQSSRRSTVNGRITRPYSDCLYTPRSRSATDQMNRRDS